MSITGPNSSTPTRAGIPIGDLGSGLFAVIGILSALISRGKTGKGQHLDLSLLDVQISLLTYMATMQTLSGIDPEPIGNAHFVHVPYNSFTTKDGFVVIAVITDAFWEELLNIVDLDCLRKKEFKSSTGRLKGQNFIESELNKKLSTKNSDYWINALNSAKVPCAPINSFSRALSDEQVIHRNMIVEVEHPDGGIVRMPGNPIKLSDADKDSFSSPPHLGAHTEETLKEWCNYSKKQIEELIKGKIIAN